MWTDPGATGSRRRILDSLAHREPDRVPLDLGGTTFTTLQADAYEALKGRLGIHTRRRQRQRHQRQLLRHRGP